jgi:hypothetical protein
MAKGVDNHHPCFVQGDIKVSETLEGMISYDLWDAYRKFSNPNILLIAKTLYKSSEGLTLGELRNETGIVKENVLNHDLTEMRRVWIIKKIDKKYHITKYGAILLESISAIELRLSNNKIKDNLFTPIGSREDLSSN